MMEQKAPASTLQRIWHTGVVGAATEVVTEAIGGVSEEGALPLLLVPAPTVAEAIEDVRNRSNVNNQLGITQSAKSVTSFMQEVLVHVGIAMRTMIMRKRKQILSPTAMASTPIGMRIPEQQIISRESWTS